MTIKELVRKSYGTSRKQGFHLNDVVFLRNERLLPRLYLSWMALITTEISEACKAIRHNDMDNFAEEMADAMIRIADTCGAMDIDLEAAIEKKMKVNELREFMHGGKLA